jgi:hypothetical protein
VKLLNLKVAFDTAKFCRLRNGFPVAPKFSEGGFVHYDNGQTAEISWSFIREFPPKEFTRPGRRGDRGGREDSKK